MKKRHFMLLGLLTLVGFSAIGFAINYFFRGMSPLELFDSEWSWYWQLPIGMGFGLVSAWLAWWLVPRTLMKEVHRFYSQVIHRLQLGWPAILFISFCAGFGEEVLFRGSLQHYMGLWITSIVFVAIHGYLNPGNWRLSIYGAYMVLVIAGMGWMFTHLGILSAITAHFIIDVVLLRRLSKLKKEPPIPQPIHYQKHNSQPNL